MRVCDVCLGKDAIQAVEVVFEEQPDRLPADFCGPCVQALRTDGWKGLLARQTRPAINSPTIVAPVARAVPVPDDQLVQPLDDDVDEIPLEGREELSALATLQRQASGGARRRSTPPPSLKPGGSKRVRLNSD